MPSVAVVIPVKNGETTIARTVRAVLAQTLPPAEVVVVDNGSTDGTAAAAEEAGARVIHEAKPGSYAARNAGLAATTSELVAFTDDDCMPADDWLERLVAPFADPGVAGAGGEIVPAGVSTPAERWAEDRDVLSQARAFNNEYLPYLATANAAYRRAVLEQLGGFEAALESGGDVDLAWRVQTLTRSRLVFVPDAVVRHTHRADVGGLLRQQRRYGRGHGALDLRWSADLAYRSAQGTTWQRLRAVWLLPARIPVRLVRRVPVKPALIDACVRSAREVGRFQGRRQYRGVLAPLPEVGTRSRT